MSTSTKCRANNPSMCIDPRCPEKRGGSHLDLRVLTVAQVHSKRVEGALRSGDHKEYLEARTAAEEAGSRAYTASVLNQSALKSLSVEDLTIVLTRHHTRDMSMADAAQVSSSARWATELHEGAYRKNPILIAGRTPSNERVPYISHPLRNTVRLARWGVLDRDVLIASVLHDTVEDCVDRMAQGAGDWREGDEAHNRSVSLRAVEQRYGKAVRDIVESVSNPILPKGTPREEANRKYAEHVQSAIMRHPGAFLVKFSDFVDNALNMHNGYDPGMSQRLSRKYLLVCPSLRAAFAQHEGYLRAHTSAEGYALMAERLDRAEAYLSRFANQR